MPVSFDELRHPVYNETELDSRENEDVDNASVGNYQYGIMAASMRIAPTGGTYSRIEAIRKKILSTPQTEG